MSQVSYGTITISDLTDGNKWYSGVLISGTGSNITPSFPSTDMTYYIEGDRYLNTTNYNIYVCITDGKGNQSRWSYTGNVQGDQGIGIDTLVKQYKYIDPTEFEREYGPYNNIESLPGFEDKSSGSSSENIVLGGTYYSRDKITWTDTSVTETEWVIDYGLMSDYANRLQEQKIAEVELKAKHFAWSDAAYVIMGEGWNPVINSAADEELPSIDIYDPDDKNTYGYYSRNGVDGISFRHNDTILGQLTSDGLNFYYTKLIPKVEQKTVTYINSNGQEQTVTHDYEAIKIVQGLKGLTLNTTGLYLYPNRDIAEDQTITPLVELNDTGLYLKDIEGKILISLTNGGQIKSGKYKPLTEDNTFSAEGTLIDLTNGAIHTPGFYTDGVSNSYFKGHIDALSGTIGGFNIAETELTNGDFFINPAGKVLDNKSDIVLSIGNNFKVDKNGNLYAANANLEGFTIGFNQVTGLNQQFSSINTQLSAHNNDITQLSNNINDTKIELSQTIEAKTQGKLDSSEFNTFKTKNNETVNSITGDITNLKTDNESFNSSLSSLQGQTQQNTEDISKFQGMIKTDKETDESSQKIHPYILITSEETNQEGTEFINMTGLKLRDDRISFQVGSNNQITTPGYITATTLVMGEINVSQVENFGRYGIEERTGGTEGTHFSIIINDTEENN